MPDNTIIYKRLESYRIAFIEARIDTRDQIPPLFDSLRYSCREAICGEALVIIHGGAVKDGIQIEAAFPVMHPVETGEIHSRTLDAVPAFILLHYGPHQTIRETVKKIYDYIDMHAWTTSLIRREIYRVLDLAEPQNNVTEVQVILHEWDQLLAESTEKVLGTKARQQLMQGIESINPESSFTEYTTWIQGAMKRLDAWTDDNSKKCMVVSHCAHVFPQERIDHLRTIFEYGEFDDILREMYNDDFWYEKPVRRGNVIYMRKNPFNPEGYENAGSPAERRKAYCHCAFVHPYLDVVPSKLSPTFCFCGAGWYRRLWEGILGQPVKIDQVETLLKGNDQCTFTITLPLDLAGECHPI